MTKIKAAIALTTVLVLAAPAVAQADKIKHRGTVTGVPGTKVKFAVKKERGELERISNMAFIDVPVTCEDGSTGTISGFLPTFPVSGEDFTRRGRIEGNGIENGFLRVEGEFSSAGRRASGQVRFSFKSMSGSGCDTDDVDWETEKK